MKVEDGPAGKRKGIKRSGKQTREVIVTRRLNADQHTAECGGVDLEVQDSGERGKTISMSLKPAWLIKQVLEQLELRRETRSQNY